MHIIESYAATARAKINKPILLPKFYPIVYDKYITIQGDAKFQSRQYEWFSEVVLLIKPILETQGIKIVQIGGANDRRIVNVDLDLCGKTSYRQSFDVISKALLHVGVDSLNVHIASVFDTKIVGIYSNMFIDHSKPFWSHPDRVKLIQAPLIERKPSYMAVDSPKIINLIKPEIIVQSILDLLDIPIKIERSSLYFGDKYSSFHLESIPDCLVDPNFSPDIALHIRYDYVAENETTKSFLYNQINLRKSVIITDKLMDSAILNQLKSNIIQAVVKITDENQLPIVLQVERLGIPYVLISDLSEEEIQKLKVVYMDHTPIQKSFISVRDKLSSTTETTLFKSSKLLLSQNKTYASKAHWLSQKESDPFKEQKIGQFVSSEEFWKESEFYYLFD